MSRMLLTGEQFKEVDIELYNKNIRAGEKNRLTFIIVWKMSLLCRNNSVSSFPLCPV